MKIALYGSELVAEANAEASFQRVDILRGRTVNYNAEGECISIVYPDDSVERAQSALDAEGRYPFTSNSLCALGALG